MTVAGPAQTSGADSVPAGREGEQLAFGLIAAINEHLSGLLALSERLALAEQSRIEELEQLIGDHAARVLQLIQGRTTP